jgi:hypothetical protein
MVRHSSLQLIVKELELEAGAIDEENLGMGGAVVGKRWG